MGSRVILKKLWINIACNKINTKNSSKMYRIIDGNGIEYNDDFTNANIINTLFA